MSNTIKVTVTFTEEQLNRLLQIQYDTLGESGDPPTMEDLTVRQRREFAQVLKSSADTIAEAVIDHVEQEFENGESDTVINMYDFIQQFDTFERSH